MLTSKGVRRKYSDREKAETLALLDAANGNLTKVAEETGIPDSTISSWRDGRGINEDVVPDLREFKKRQLSDKFALIAHKFLNLAYEKTEDIKSNSWMPGAGIATEKHLLLSGQPTSIVQNLTAKLTKDFPDVPAEELEQYASELLQ